MGVGNRAVGPWQIMLEHNRMVEAQENMYTADSPSHARCHSFLEQGWRSQ